MPIEPDDICYNKAAIIERTLRRLKEEYSFDPELQNFTHIDAMVLNVERACQAAIDLAGHLTAQYHLGIPQNSAEAFQLLAKNGLLSKETAQAMVAMTGFRNIAIHEYQTLDMQILRAIATERWQSLVKFCRELGMNIEP